MEEKIGTEMDWHCHTSFSDGELNVFDVFDLAKKRNIKYLAITDHDTIINLKGLRKIAKHYGIELIEGIELSVGEPYNMHILGYGIIGMEAVENYLEIIKKQNDEICKSVIKLLQEEGYEISYDIVLADMERTKIGNEMKYKVARERIKESNSQINFEYGVKNQLLDKRAIARVLVKKGYAKNNLEVYEKIMGRNCKCYIPIKKINAKDAIELINKNGGIAVLAHPGLINIDKQDRLEDLIRILKLYGLSGVEILNMDARDEEIEIKLKNITKLEGLIETCGTDFHRRSDRHNSILGIPEDRNMIQNILKAIEKSNNKYCARNEEVCR